MSEQQYATSANLQARIALHERFSTNPQSWPSWMFDQLDLLPTSQILEIGGGTGALWRENVARMPTGWQITLSDLSAGMLAQAKAALSDDPRFRFEQIDAQSIPFAAEAFDAVIANHMLYHVPDRPRALREIRRMLKPNGRLYAATNGNDHLRELKMLVQTFTPDTEIDFFSTPFKLENGLGQLAPYFANVTMRRFDCDLLVTETAPLVDYILSTERIAPERRDELTAFITDALDQHNGALHIHKASGLFIANRQP